MKSFEIKGDNGFLKIDIVEVFGYPDKTCNYGGYECRADIEIKIPCYEVKGNFYTSTGELYKFHKLLKECQTKLQGEVEYLTSENNLEIKVKYTEMGRTMITGKFQQQMGTSNCLEFEINSDQSFIKYTVDELSSIVLKYGNMTGIVKGK